MQTEQEDSLSVRADETVTTSRLKDTDKDASEVVEVGLHVEAVEEMLQDTPTRRIGIGISISRPSGLGQER